MNSTTTSHDRAIDSAIVRQQEAARFFEKFCSHCDAEGYIRGNRCVRCLGTGFKIPAQNRLSAQAFIASNKLFA